MAHFCLHFYPPKYIKTKDLIFLFYVICQYSFLCSQFLYILLDYRWHCQVRWETKNKTYIYSFIVLSIHDTKNACQILHSQTFFFGFRMEFDFFSFKMLRLRLICIHHIQFQIKVFLLAELRQYRSYIFFNIACHLYTEFLHLIF